MLDFIKSKRELIIQFFKFGIVGLLNTVLAYIITNGSYILFDKTGIIGDSVTVMSQTSNFITYVITVFISFMLNGRFVFNNENQREMDEGEKRLFFWKSLFKVYACYAITSLVINGGLIYVEETIYHIPHYIATFFNLIITVPLNFILNKFWAYK